MSPSTPLPNSGGTPAFKVYALVVVYNEALYLDYALRSIEPFVDGIAIVEGAYQNAVGLGLSPRSTDGTLDILAAWQSHPKVRIRFANEPEEPQQRQNALDLLRESWDVVPDRDWMFLVDGDEIHAESDLRGMREFLAAAAARGQYALWVENLCFVNDFWHYTPMLAARFFRLTPHMRFIGDCDVVWPDRNLGWHSYARIVHLGWGTHWWPIAFVDRRGDRHIGTVPRRQFRQFHYSYCKGSERFEIKRDWWRKSRGDSSWGWEMVNGRVEWKGAPRQRGFVRLRRVAVMPFRGQHPELMRSHPRYAPAADAAATAPR
jgi:glycosyltransferase involved in cell wall biosynthesis